MGTPFSSFPHAHILPTIVSGVPGNAVLIMGYTPLMVCQLDQALGPRYVIKFTLDGCVRLAWVRVFWKATDFEYSTLASVMWMGLIQSVDSPSRTKYTGIHGQERMLQQELPNLNCHMPWSPAWEPTLQISDSHVSLLLSITLPMYIGTHILLVLFL